MKRLIYLAQIVAAGLVVLSPATAQFPAALRVTLNIPGQNPVALVSIVDQAPDDKDRKPNAISFDLKLPWNGGVVEAKGHAVLTLTPTAANTASVVFDEVTLTNTGNQPVSASLSADSPKFGPFGSATTPFEMRTRLWGKYVVMRGSKTGLTGNPGISIFGQALDATGAVLGSPKTVDGPAAAGKKPEVQFGPKDTNTKIGQPVSGLLQFISFDLNQFDSIVLVGSAATTGYTADQVITVTTTEDLPDLNPGAGCTGCSLRQAMVEADIPPAGINSTAINFNIPGTSIPVIKIDNNTSFNFGSMGTSVHPVIIDGTTQPGSGMVEIDGSSAASHDAGGSPIVGFQLDNTNSAILGLDIHSFPNDAIQIGASGAPVTGSDAVLENIIGADPTGTVALPNGGVAVHILQQSTNIVMDNIIAFNVGEGIVVDGPASGNLIQWNQEIGNARGILLTNGANNSQSPPILTSASTDGFNVNVSGTVHSVASSQVILNVFANSQCDSTGAGQAEQLLGLTLVDTDASGDGSFSDSYAANLPSGEVVTATATDPNNNTSQLSACTTISETTTTQPPIADAGSNQTVTVGTLVTLNGTGSSDPNTPPLPLTYQWTQTSGPTVTLNGAQTATPTFTPTTPGTYIFSLVVNNGISSSTPATVTITVTPPSITEQLQSLIAQVQALDVPDNVKNPLLVHLNNASKFIARSQNAQAIQSLNVFIHLVQVNERRGISAEEGAALIDAANQLIASL